MSLEKKWRNKKIYGEENIFNCDETALFYKSSKNKGFVTKTDDKSGIKQRKERLTILLCYSSTGEKYTPLILGKSISPRSLKNQNLLDLGVEYDSSKNAWMTKNIFLNWLSIKLIYEK